MKNNKKNHLFFRLTSLLIVFSVWLTIWLNYEKYGSIFGYLANDYTKEIELKINNITDWVEAKEDTQENAKEEISLDKLWKVYEILNKKAVEQEKLKNYKHIEDSIIAWLVRSLDDPYSLYMTQKENKNFKEDLAWNFEWIWAELQMKNELVSVVSPLKDSPAIKAGLRPQDIIIKVDDQDITGWSLTDVVKIIRWPKWEKVILSVLRAWASWIIKIEIIRDVIHINSVKYEIKNWTWALPIAYISINQFWDSTVREYFEALNSASSDNVKAIILDLRYNWWGYLEGSVVIASPFLKTWDMITSVKSKNATDNKTAIKYNTKIKDLPMVVLINLWSASASEIVAWALRDHKKAILVWSRSFWKWTVQELVPLSWKSSLRVTTAKWYTPNGQNIHKVWIKPDVDIVRHYEDISTWKDAVIEKAIELLNEWHFERFYDEKTSLTWSSILNYNSSWALVIEKDDKDE